MVRALVSVALLGLVMGCSSSSPKALGTSRCEAASLPAGAVLSYGGGGGITGAYTRYDAFPDGRVDVTTTEKGAPKTVTVASTADRIARLAVNVRETEVLDEEDGCYVPDEPQPDGTGATVQLRDAAAIHSWTYEDGGDAPDEVIEATRVAGAFLQELVDQGALPKTN